MPPSPKFHSHEVTVSTEVTTGVGLNVNGKHPPIGILAIATTGFCIRIKFVLVTDPEQPADNVTFKRTV